MKSRLGWVVLLASLAALIAWVFVYPHRMISPGALMPQHTELEDDCFACHTAWRGASSIKCVRCHVIDDIGLRTTKGVPIAARTLKASFHRDLIEQDCMACHSDHAGPLLARGHRKAFAHAMLRSAVRLLCESCHQGPDDRLHRGIQRNCAACHRAEAWKPATFDHDKFFVLDRDHNVACDTCHGAGGFRRYTCYGCHEHERERVRAEHLEEGIADIEQCVTCHRSAVEEPRDAERREGASVFPNMEMLIGLGRFNAYRRSRFNSKTAPQA